MANQCWGLISAGIAAMTVTHFPRRRMFLLCTISMLLVFIGWTVSMKEVLSANARNMTNHPAAIAVLFFIFAYSPCYNIGNNALTYSSSLRPSFHLDRADFRHSIPHRTLPLRRTFPRYRDRTILRTRRKFLLHIRKPHCAQGNNMEIPSHILWLDLY